MSTPGRVRASLGTAVRLGLIDGNTDSDFVTAFLMTYHPDGCTANCTFCPQARTSSAPRHLLSRIGWPDFPLPHVVAALARTRGLQRLCVQCLRYPEMVDDVTAIVRAALAARHLPVSVSIPPVPRHDLVRLRQAGVERVGIAMDASTPTLFDRVKGRAAGGPYSWDTHIDAIHDALRVFGPGRVTTHLIIGLGESETEAADFIFDMLDLGVTVGLFAFTSIRGTALAGRRQPDIGTYRRVQVIRYLATAGAITREQVSVDPNGHIHLDMPRDRLVARLESGDAFRVSGCKGCNRPYYNERPSGPMYNYPRPLTEAEVRAAIDESQLT